MALYKARKGNEEFSIQPEMIVPYSIAGFTIIKMEEVIVHDVNEEIKSFQSYGETAKMGGNSNE